MKILFAIAEAYPFIMTGGLGDVAGSLPHALREKSVCCRVVLPLYSDIPDSVRPKMKYIADFIVPVGWRKQYCGVFETHVGGTIYYLLDNEYYFKRPGIYGHHDDAERFTFFSRAVLEMIKYIDFKPDIIQANDWHTALVPVYKKLLYEDLDEYKNIKTIFTIHNILYQGQFGIDIFADIIGLNTRDLPILEYNGYINMMKAAIVTADAVTTVSPTYAKELMDPYYANGLEKIMQNNSSKLYGIINGIDTDNYDPETDESILQGYSINNISGKMVNKTALQKMFGLPVDEAIPVLGMVTRLVDHKGLDLLKTVIEDILSDHIQFIMLGKGDPLHETYFLSVARRYPGKMAIKIGYIPDIARKIYAGADMFLMPSKSEPCGLSQMVCLRYGTIPIVRETGGLKDTVTDCGDGLGNGFTFKSYDAQEMLGAIKRAEDVYCRKQDWEILMNRALSCNNCWQNSADKYIQLYKKISN